MVIYVCVCIMFFWCIEGIALGKEGKILGPPDWQKSCEQYNRDGLIVDADKLHEQEEHIS